MKRRFVVLVVAALAGAGGAWGLFSGSGEVSFGGLDAAAWRRELGSGDGGRRARARGRLRRGGAEAVPVLVALGRRRDLEVTVERILGAIGPDAVPALVSALASESTADRIAAADGLGVVGYADPSARRALLASLRDVDAAVRATAARSLARAGSPEREVLEALSERFVDPDVRVRHEAAWSHYRLARRVEPVLPVFTDEVRDGRAAFFRAAFVLEELGPRAAPAVPALVRRLEGDDPLLWSTACGVLFRIGRSAAAAADPLERLLVRASRRDPGFDPEEWRRLERRVRLACACALLAVDPASGAGRAAVDRFLVAGHPLERAVALGAVWRSGADRDRVLALLPELVADPEATGAAIRLTAEVGAPAKACVPALVGRLAEPDRARAAALALAAIGPDARAAVPALLALLESAPLPVRSAAACALWRVDGRAEEAVACLLAVIAASAECDQEAGYGAVSLLAGMSLESGRARRALREVAREGAWPARLAARKAVDVLGQRE